MGKRIIVEKGERRKGWNEKRNKEYREKGEGGGERRIGNGGERGGRKRSNGEVEYLRRWVLCKIGNIFMHNMFSMKLL